MSEQTSNQVLQEARSEIEKLFKDLFSKPVLEVLANLQKDTSKEIRKILDEIEQIRGEGGEFKAIQEDTQAIQTHFGALKEAETNNTKAIQQKIGTLQQSTTKIETDLNILQQAATSNAEAIQSTLAVLQQSLSEHNIHAIAAQFAQTLQSHLDDQAAELRLVKNKLDKLVDKHNVVMKVVVSIGVLQALAFIVWILVFH
jgi:hypothetical protein